MKKEYIPKPINSTDKYFKKLEREGKVKNLNSRNDFERQKRLNEDGEETRIYYLSMEAVQ